MSDFDMAYAGLFSMMGGTLLTFVVRPALESAAYTTATLAIFGMVVLLSIGTSLMLPWARSEFGGGDSE